MTCHSICLIRFPFHLTDIYIKQTIWERLRKISAHRIKYYEKNPVNICGAMHDLVPFVQFKKSEKHLWASVTFRLPPAALLKVTLLHMCFSCFLNCTNGTKSRKASHMVFNRNYIQNPK